MEKELFDQGLTLMLAGMGTVFMFLTVLVAGMTLMSKTIMRFQRQPESTEATDEEVAAISAAVSRHRNKK
jgi:oxaloacetate decarboxylase gamma subunit